MNELSIKSVPQGLPRGIEAHASFYKINGKWWVALDVPMWLCDELMELPTLLRMAVRDTRVSEATIVAFRLEKDHADDAPPLPFTDEERE